MAPAGIWPDLLKEHHRALVILLESIDAVAADNLSALEQEREPADAEPDDLAIMTLDVNVQRARAAVTSAALPSLRDFLGTT